jgi:hypothetical protein
VKNNENGYIYAMIGQEKRKIKVTKKSKIDGFLYGIDARYSFIGYHFSENAIIERENGKSSDFREKISQNQII